MPVTCKMPVRALSITCPLQVGSFLWRLSGTSGEFSMIGLGDIVRTRSPTVEGLPIDRVLVTRSRHGVPVMRSPRDAVLSRWRRSLLARDHLWPLAILGSM